jgi:CubicO group peptidase (beta-lactamase class C family)
MSKQFTALSVLLLARQGKLSLDDPIRKFLPEMPAYQAPITIRQLLYHTSGIRDYLTLAFLAGKGPADYYSAQDVLRLLARQKELNFNPGDEHLYSNSGYFLLSQIVRRASGLSLRAFADSNIFKPLGMDHTHFHDDYTRIVKNRATGYTRILLGGYQLAMSNLDMVGDGGVHTSVEDLLRWDQNFYQCSVGGEDLIRRMQTPGVLNSGETLDYACGLVVTRYRALRMVTHDGAWAGYRAAMIRFPDQRFSVVCLCNLATANAGQLARQVAELYLSELLLPEPGRPAAVDLPPEQLQNKTGDYWNPASGGTWHLALEEGKLTMSVPGLRHQLIPLAPDRFHALNNSSRIQVLFDRNGPARGLRMRVSQEGRKPEVFERVEFVSPTAQQLAEYAGDYYSDELECTYQVVLREGSLYLDHRNAPTTALQPTVADHFRLRGLAISFARDRSSRVSSLSVNAGRVRNIRFVRK